MIIVVPFSLLFAAWSTTGANRDKLGLDTGDIIWVLGAFMLLLLWPVIRDLVVAVLKVLSIVRAPVSLDRSHKALANPSAPKARRNRRIPSGGRAPRRAASLPRP